MKTLNYNQRRVFYGALIICLALTKSWFFETPTSGHGDFALNGAQFPAFQRAQHDAANKPDSGAPPSTSQLVRPNQGDGSGVTSLSQTTTKDGSETKLVYCDDEKPDLSTITIDSREEKYQHTCFKKQKSTKTAYLEDGTVAPPEDVFVTSVTIFPCGTKDCEDTSYDTLEVAAKTLTEAEHKLKAYLTKNFKDALDEENARLALQEKQDECLTDKNDKDLSDADQFKCLGKSLKGKKSKDDKMAVIEEAKDRIDKLLADGSPASLRKAKAAIAALKSTAGSDMSDAVKTLADYTTTFSKIVALGNDTVRNRTHGAQNFQEIKDLLATWSRKNAICQGSGFASTGRGCSDSKTDFTDEVTQELAALGADAERPEIWGKNEGAAEAKYASNGNTSNGIEVDGTGARATRYQYGTNGRSNNGGINNGSQFGTGNQFNQQQNPLGSSLNTFNGSNLSANNSLFNTGTNNVTPSIFNQSTANRSTMYSMPAVNFCQQPAQGYCATGLSGRS